MTTSHINIDFNQERPTNSEIDKMLSSLTIHEAAHALTASWRGDDTAKNEGRLTLNPFAHADPVGTFLFPLIGAVLSLPLIN